MDDLQIDSLAVRALRSPHVADVVYARSLATPPGRSEPERGSLETVALGTRAVGYVTQSQAAAVGAALRRAGWYHIQDVVRPGLDNLRTEVYP